MHITAPILKPTDDQKPETSFLALKIKSYLNRGFAIWLLPLPQVEYHQSTLNELYLDVRAFLLSKQ